MKIKKIRTFSTARNTEIKIKNNTFFTRFLKIMFIFPDLYQEVVENVMVVVREMVGADMNRKYTWSNLVSLPQIVYKSFNRVYSISKIFKPQSSDDNQCSHKEGLI